MSQQRKIYSADFKAKVAQAGHQRSTHNQRNCFPI